MPTQELHSKVEVNSPTAQKAWPEGPKGVPFLGNLLGLARDPLAFYTECAQQYGDIVGMRLGSWPALLLNDPNDIEYVLVKHSQDFVKNSFFWRHVTAIFGNGLLTSEGEYWHRQRRLAAPAFTGSQLPSYGNSMVRHTKAMLDEWKAGEVRDVHADMMVLTLRIAAESFFGAVVEEDVDVIKRDGDVITREIATRFKRPFVIPDIFPWPGHIRYRRSIHRLEKIVVRIVRERRINMGNSNDLLSSLMKARDEDGQPMSDRQLRDEGLTLLLAGQETSAIALSWCFYLIGQHRDVHARMSEEAKAVLQGRDATVEDLPRLNYIEKVIKEAMRLLPPAWAIGREATIDCEIGNYFVPRGTTIFICPWVLHHSARYFDDPAEFRPERWDGSLEHRLPRFAYMPFGGGPRICIGNRFALMEISLVIATVLQHFELQWDASRPVVPLPSITLRPEGGVWMKLSSRQT